MSTPCLITGQGKRALGEILKKARERLGYSLDDLVDYILKKTGQTISKSSLSEIERGTVDPKWNTLSILAASGYLDEAGEHYTVTELFEIACEKISYAPLNKQSFIAADNSAHYKTK